jgi:hypothetical protein
MKQIIAMGGASRIINQKIYFFRQKEVRYRSPAYLGQTEIL